MNRIEFPGQDDPTPDTGPTDPVIAPPTDDPVPVPTDPPVHIPSDVPFDPDEGPPTSDDGEELPTERPGSPPA